MNRQTSRSQIANAAPVDLDVFIIECRASDGSLYFSERPAARCNRIDTRDDIRDAQEENVSRVIKFNTATFSCEDVTEEMARAVMASDLDQRQGLSEHLYEFLTGSLGFATVHTAQREDRA